MQRHVPLIEKDIVEDSLFWKAIKKYITPNIITKLDVDNFIEEINDFGFSDIDPLEFRAVHQKISDLYKDQKIDPMIISYNIFLGQTHYQKLMKKATNFNMLNF